MTPDYHKAVCTAIRVLEEFHIRQAPIDLRIIFEALANELHLLGYSDFMEYNQCSLEETIKYMDSSDGACMYDATSGQYVIWYNDVDPAKVLRKRFTISHELGHYFLRHLEKLGTNILRREGLSEEEYQELEKEANAFARNLLTPAPLAEMVLELSPEGWKNSNVETAFNISNSAANVRINLLRRDLRDYSGRLLEYVKHMTLLFRKVCFHCHTEAPFDADHCEMCGGKNFYYDTEYTPLPPALPMDRKSGRIKICPRCNNIEASLEARYCRICGLPIRNMCTGDPKTGRRHANRSYARYCSECGAPTEYGILAEKAGNDIGRGTQMKYTDGVKYDPKTDRVKICPRCANEEFSAAAKFCRICGTDLYNYCIGDPLNEGFDNDPDRINQHPNPSNARYCEVCGKPTEYFVKGLLPEYSVYQKNLAQDEVQLGLFQTVDEALANMRNGGDDETAEETVSSEPQPDETFMDFQEEGETVGFDVEEQEAENNAVGYGDNMSLPFS